MTTVIDGTTSYEIKPAGAGPVTALRAGTPVEAIREWGLDHSRSLPVVSTVRVVDPESRQTWVFRVTKKGAHTVIEPVR